MTWEIVSESVYEKAQNLIIKADSYDETLWNFIHNKGDSFNGSAKDLNYAFLRGIYLAINEPKEFDLWDEGWTNGVGWSVKTLAEHVVEVFDGK